MSGLLDSILNNTGSVAPRIVSENHDVSQINFVAGLSDPGEMIRCGYLPEIRRRANEGDAEYAERIRPIVMALPQAERDLIMRSAQRRARLDTSNGRVNAAFAGKAPWHGLGVVVNGAMTSAEALSLAGLNWQVKKEQLSFTFNGATKPADSWGIIRQDTGDYLGTVGSRYEPVQNEEGFKFLDSAIGQFGARYESAGAIYGGKSVWMLAHMPAQRFNVNGDQIEPYVIFTNCHDGTGAAYCYPTTVRVECANTFRTATRERSKGLSIRHTGKVLAKIESAKKVLGLAVTGFEEFKAAAETLVAKKAEIKPYATSVLDAIFAETEAKLQERLDNSLEHEIAEAAWERHQTKRREMLAEIMERYEAGRCHPAGTAWAAFNAVTEYADHHEGRQRGDAQTRLSRRFESTLAGERDELKQVAFSQALAL